MNTVVVKKYVLTDEERRALEKAKLIIRDLQYEGFSEEFCDHKSVYLEDLENSLEDILEMDCEDWSSC